MLRQILEGRVVACKRQTEISKSHLCLEIKVPLTHTVVVVVVGRSLSQVPCLVPPWTAACQASLSFTISWSLLKFISIETMMSFNHHVLCWPLLLLLSIFPSTVFSNELALHIRWPKYWSFSIHPFNEYSGLTSFMIDWFDLFAVQGTLKSLIQHHNLKASIFQCSVRHNWATSLSFYHSGWRRKWQPTRVLAWRIPGTEEPSGLPSMGSHRVGHYWSDLAAAAAVFFMVQLSHPYTTTGNTRVLTMWTLSGKWCLCFLMCCLGLSWLFFQGASVFRFHGCSHHPQWLWSQRKQNLSRFPLFPHLFLSQ